MMCGSMRILYFGDNMLQQKLIAFYLRRIHELQFTITNAGREEAEAVTEVSGQLPDLVFLDYQLSEDTAQNCLQTLRSHYPMVPITVVSGPAIAETTARVLRDGADDYISGNDLGSARLARSLRTAQLRVAARRRFSASGDAGETPVRITVDASATVPESPVVAC